VIDERARHNLYRAIEDLLDTEQADTLMALLPPVGWADIATRVDLHQLEARLGDRIEREHAWSDARFATKDDLHRLEARLDAGLDARFARERGWAEARFEAVDNKNLDGSLGAERTVPQTILVFTR
jgi:hypothetical protein